jgi:hypothetical protein
MACSQYIEDLQGCMSAATKASTILPIVRLFMDRGEVPNVAARFAARQGGREDLAVLAMTAPAELTPREFSNRVMKAYLSEIAR